MAESTPEPPLRRSILFLTIYNCNTQQLTLIIQPYIYYCLIKPWFRVFEIPQLKQGFSG